MESALSYILNQIMVYDMQCIPTGTIYHTRQKVRNLVVLGRRKDPMTAIALSVAEYINQT